MTKASAQLSFQSELRRAFNGYNLTIGAAFAIAVATIAYFSLKLWLSWLIISTWQISIIIMIVVFILVTGLHAIAHGYYGWRLARGIKAAHAGHYLRAQALLAVVERAGMNHYDELGLARAALIDSRLALSQQHNQHPD